MRRARHKNQKKNIQKQKKFSELEVSSSPLFSKRQISIMQDCVIWHVSGIFAGDIINSFNIKDEKNANKKEKM